MGVNDYIVGYKHSEEEIEYLKELSKIKEAKTMAEKIYKEKMGGLHS